MAGLDSGGGQDGASLAEPGQDAAQKVTGDAPGLAGSSQRAEPREDPTACPRESLMGLWGPPKSHRWAITSPLPPQRAETQHLWPLPGSLERALLRAQPPQRAMAREHPAQPDCFPRLELAPGTLLCFVNPQEKSTITVCFPIPSPRFPSCRSQGREPLHLAPRPLPPSPLSPSSLLWSTEYPSH